MTNVEMAYGADVQQIGVTPLAFLLISLWQGIGREI